MGVKLRLPEPSELPKTVIFHREDPAEPIVILQVPEPGVDSSETYYVRLDKPEHLTWLRKLKRHDRLEYLLSMEPHVAYEVGSGDATPLKDLDLPGPFVEDFADARSQATSLAERERQHAIRRAPMLMSPLRASLMGARRQRAHPVYGGRARGRLL